MFVTRRAPFAEMYHKVNIEPSMRCIGVPLIISDSMYVTPCAALHSFFIQVAFYILL